MSEHFTLSELCRTSRGDGDNTPNLEQIDNLERLCRLILEPIRKLLGSPLHINSGFRDADTNKAVGGAPNSAHLDGRAADWVPMRGPAKGAFVLVMRSEVPFDKLILETRDGMNYWVHVQVAKDGAEPRKLAYTAAPGPSGAMKYTRCY